MRITAYGGSGEIGGNRFLLETSGTKIFLDFGIPFDRMDKFYSGIEYLEGPRGGLGLKDHLEMGLVPKLKGVYSKSSLRFTDYPYKKPDIDGVFISHIHADHFGDAQWIDKDIPVFMGEGSRLLNSVYNNCFMKCRTYEAAGTRSFKTGERIKAGNITVTPYPVDHSTPAAFGFIIETEEGNLAYTGDYRFHGFVPHLTEVFMKKAAEANVRILMTEGTRMKGDDALLEGSKSKLTEPEVEGEMYRAIRDSRGITVVSFSVRNIDRVRSLYNAVKKAGKILYTSARMAYVVDTTRHLYEQNLFEIKGNPAVKIFRKNGDREKGRTYDYEKPYSDSAEDYRSAAKNRKNAVIFLAEWELDQMIDIKPEEGTYIFSTAEHYLEGPGFEKKKSTLMRWLKHFNLDFKYIHCSGHADEAGIKKMVKTINPEILIPMHTQNPKKFEEIHKKVIHLKHKKTREV